MKPAIFLVLLHALVWAQSPAFEVASVKKSPFRQGGFFGCRAPDPGLYVCTNSTVARMAFQAYDLKLYQMEGVNDDKDLYDVQAKIPAGATPADIRLMLQNLLAERFQLKFHYQKKEIQVYELVIARSGLKMKEAPADAAQPTPGNLVKDADGFTVSRGQGGVSSARSNGLERLTGNAARIAGLVSMLASRLQVTVIDATPLTGKYDFTVTYSLEGLAGAPPSDNPTPGRSILAAVEKDLGLTLEKKKRDIDLFVIDHVDKSGAENF